MSVVEIRLRPKLLNDRGSRTAGGVLKSCNPTARSRIQTCLRGQTSRTLHAASCSSDSVSIGRTLLKPATHVVFFLSLSLLVAEFAIPIAAQNSKFHNAPPSAKDLKNPVEGQSSAISAGRKVYLFRCSRCHGKNAEGSGNIPALVDGALESVTPGEVFWFVTKGSPNNGMPSWAKLPERQRWEVVSYVKSLGLSEVAPARQASKEAPPAATAAKLKAPPPKAPFTDFRYEKPGTVRKITVKDLPPPNATPSADNGAEVVARPRNAWPTAPAGFKVEQYATGFDEPRLLRAAPNGDIFLAESSPGRIRVFRGMTDDGKPEQMQVFVSGLKRPY